MREGDDFVFGIIQLVVIVLPSYNFDFSSRRGLSGLERIGNPRKREDNRTGTTFVDRYD
jgi:hypothetical protein